MSGDEFDFSEEARITNEELATEIARITPLTAAKLAEILPQCIDDALAQAVAWQCR